MKFYDIFSNLCAQSGVAASRVLFELGISKSSCTSWKQGRNGPSNATLKRIAEYFDVPVEYLQTGEMPTDRKGGVEINDDFVSFPVVGEVAAGYGHIALEDWTGDTIQIPTSYLKGRSKDEFFVLRVTGNSMYPDYREGDKVLVLRQSTLNRSGQVGVVMYDGDTSTLKKIEYVMGEDWMKLVPINPTFPPIKIVGEELERCRVLGIPKMLIRDIEE